MDLPTCVTLKLRSAQGLPSRPARDLSHSADLAHFFIFVATLFIPFFGAVAAPVTQQKPAPDAAIAKNIRFSLTAKDPPTAVAEVSVERIAKETRKRTISEIMRLDWFSGIIAEGVTVRFQRMDLQALPSVPEKIRALAKVKRLEIHHLSIYAPGDSVPRLIAGEVEMRPDSTWSLKRVLLAGRSSMNNCTLRVGADGEIRISTALGKPLALRALLSEIDNPAFVSSPVDFANPPSSASAELATKSPLVQDLRSRPKR